MRDLEIMVMLTVMATAILQRGLVVSEAVRIPNYVVIPAIGISMLFLSLFGVLIYYRVRKPAKSKEEILKELKNGNRES